MSSSSMEVLAQSIIEGKVDEIKDLVQQALDEGLPPEDVLDNGLMKGMEVVGKRFAADDMFIPEVMLSARTMHEALELLRPVLEEQDKKLQMKGKMILGTVAGDIHDIGKSLVEMMFIANGFEVVDLGIDVSAEDFVEAVKKHEPDVVGMSALLTSTMPAMAETIEAIDGAGLRKESGLKVIVGGAPVTADYAEEIGADFYGENALDAVKMISEVLAP
ncbi:MAG: cobalamin-binding protein [Firmicutes bacterium]|nr:cobalamin-binding protein [Bacillota bacterium]